MIGNDVTFTIHEQIEIIYLEFVVVILFAIQFANGDDPAGVRIDAEWQLVFVDWQFSADQRDDPIGDLGVVGVVCVVRLNADDTVADGHVLNDRFLKERRVESGRVVVDVTDVDQQLGGVGAARVAAVLGSDDQPVTAHRFEIQRLNDGHVTAQRVDDKVALRVAADQRVTKNGVGSDVGIRRSVQIE